jgi:predicted TPR repeat methyltransferase
MIDGIDISPEMLAKAATKTHEGRPTYRQLFEADLTDRWTRIAVFTVA